MKSLALLIKAGFGEEEDYNCAEKILYGANVAYDMGLDKESLKLAAGFGSGMGVEDVCGVVCASCMVLSYFFVNNVAHEGTRIKELTSEYISRYHYVMGSINCRELQEQYRSDYIRCYWVIYKAAEILDDIVFRELAIGQKNNYWE